MKAKILFFFFVSSIGSYLSCHANTTANRSQSDSILIAYLNECGIQTSTENEVEILKSGHDKFIDLFEEIKKAKHHIHLEYFNFRNDSIANSLFDILEIKAKEGVEIRAIYDAFGNSSNNRPLKKKHIKSKRYLIILTFIIEGVSKYKFPFVWL